MTEYKLFILVLLVGSLFLVGCSAFYTLPVPTVSQYSDFCIAHNGTFKDYGGLAGNSCIIPQSDGTILDYEVSYHGVGDYPNVTSVINFVEAR